MPGDGGKPGDYTGRGVCWGMEGHRRLPREAMRELRFGKIASSLKETGISGREKRMRDPECHQQRAGCM